MRNNKKFGNQSGNGKPVNIGRLGEGIACAYLLKNKWKILYRNYYLGFDEIDIIALSHTGILVFFEVKARLVSSISMGLKAEDNLTKAKFKKISRACRLFAGKNPHLMDEEKGWQIDLLAIDVGLNNTILDIRHHENIFFA